MRLCFRIDRVASIETGVGPIGLNTGVLNAGNWGSGLVLGVRVALRNRLQEPAQ